MAYKPKNEIISDIYYGIVANLPVKGEAFPYDVRGDFARGWQFLEKRIEQYYEKKGQPKAMGQEINVVVSLDSQPKLVKNFFELAKVETDWVEVRPSSRSTADWLIANRIAEREAALKKQVFQSD